MSNSYTFGRKKAGTSTFSNPSLVSPHTPTLSNPTGGFSLPTNNLIQTATEQSTNLKEAQSANEQSLLSETVEQTFFSHDISRIALRRPQAKLTVGEPGDKYEQEADWMANQVMRMVVPNKLNSPSEQPIQNSLQRKCAASEEEEDKVQTKPSLQSATDGGLRAGDNIESQIDSSKGRGSPLSDRVRGFMEPRFGVDFSSVRVHTGSEAMQMNRELGAEAFTHGSDIYFGAGKSAFNNELMAHELTHVVQQTGAVQTKQVSKQPTVQRKCSVWEKEEPEVQREPNISALSQPEIQRWSLFDDDEDKQQSESSSGGGILDWAKDKASGAVDSVTQAGGDAYDWAKDKASGAVDSVTQAGGDAYDWAKDKASGAVDSVTQAGGDAYDWAKDKASGAVDSVTDSGGQVLDLISNWRSIQVDWNSEPGMLLRSWASQLDPEIVLDISGKSPADLYNVVDVPDQIQQAGKELAKQVKMDVTPGFAPSPNIPLPDIDIPGIPDRKPKRAPNPPTEPSPAPDSPSSPSPLLFLLLLIGIIIFLAILYYGSKKKAEASPGSGYKGGGGRSGGGGSTGSWDDKKSPEDEKPRGGMRSQIQRGDDHLGSADVVASDPKRGVTAREFEQTAMMGALNNYRDRRSKRIRPYGTERNENNITFAFATQSQLIRSSIVPGGGVNQGGDINALRQQFKDAETGDDIRIDVENTSGHNLRFNE